MLIWKKVAWDDKRHKLEFASWISGIRCCMACRHLDLNILIDWDWPSLIKMDQNQDWSRLTMTDQIWSRLIKHDEATWFGEDFESKLLSRFVSWLSNIKPSNPPKLVISNTWYRYGISIFSMLLTRNFMMWKLCCKCASFSARVRFYPILQRSAACSSHVPQPGTSTGP